ncbi:MAG: SynChlorMet cassette protein ScmC [Candidatus Omnitrophota bacterium]|nr:SynChlorMet cassette protein ScmC [Candidatus Omnitrophota bacterium]
MRAYRLALSSGQQWCVIDATHTYPLFKELFGVLGLSVCGQPFFPAVALFEAAHVHSETKIQEIVSQFDFPPSRWHRCYARGAEWWVSDTIPAQALCLLPPGPADQIIPQQLYHIISGIFFNVYRRLLDRGGISLHAALLEHMGRGALIVAPSGTGKTTCYQRVPRPWQGLCDEEALVSPDLPRLWQAHPMINITDFAVRGRRIQHDIQQGYPLKGLYFLEHGCSDSVMLLGKGEASARLFRATTEVFVRYRGWHCYQKDKYRLRQFENASALARNVPCYKLAATLTGKFWEKIEPTLSHGQ